MSFSCTLKTWGGGGGVKRRGLQKENLPDKDGWAANLNGTPNDFEDCFVAPELNPEDVPTSQFDDDD